MRHMVLLSAGLVGALTLASCSKEIDKDAVERALQDVNVVDESNLNSVILSSADPNEAVSYFQRSVTETPGRIDLNRGLATSLIRAKRYTEAQAAWERVASLPDATADDKVNLADAMIRNNNWDTAKQVLDTVPPTHETFKRYRLEAMVADSEENWKAADSFYETAIGLTTKPAGVLNNWGYSKLTRGDYREAERLFGEALRQDPNLFTAKNNLVLARGAQRNYSLPVIAMTQTERAQLLHTMALSAVKQGDVSIGEGLLREAIETHPQHFDAAARALAALENG
ncbi:lipopolysaccharide assembly protein LapB [Phaeobacter sp. HF9A]|uniref:tetratricopeptide repeat protein n=1 Tax=Phaeobacter sp. HF9A TaxID=2721561 RepID=UPI0014320F0B|nr:tetratricopeptide repeat protein [Phaeobacter sp. HF9A]NIZ13365.1 tetratricopeptide repeat protein [Phaeobacter sp. HF9A]